MIRLCRRFRNCKYTIGWSCDTEFIIVYLLRKRYSMRVDLTNLSECVLFSRRQVLLASRTPDIIYGPRTGLDDLYIKLVINTERAMHKFSKKMKRHEIFDVYMEVPPNSIGLKEIVDLFYPNDDTKGKSPRKILAVGRPGIGKTVLTEKIMQDWANGIDEYYCGKYVFYFKFRWFNLSELKDVTLKTFLRCGTELGSEEFAINYKYITVHPEKAILIFDGLDEFSGSSECLEHLPPQNDPDICMSGISLFIKLISGRFLPGATVLVTSRPTANKFYSRFNFDRTVEIVGFTSDKIEEYVSRFCDNNRSDLKPKIWNHVNSSSDLLNLCYIPANCFIVSVILFGCLSDPRNEAGALPTTLTEIYQAAIVHFGKHHYRSSDGQSSGEAMKKLQLLAYNGIEHRRLVFSSELFDEQMQRSGLLNRLSNPIYPIQTQFCFIHLTIQEFLAARHVIEMFAPEEITEFITTHIESGKWHLVLQFIAGLLGKKIKIDENCYKDCVLAFTQSSVVKDGVIDLSNYSLLFVLKCLKEVDDDEIVKEACQTGSMNSVVSLNYSTPDTILTSHSLSDWAAVTSICKYMNKFMTLDLDLSHLGKECHHEVMKLLRTRCIKQLTFVIRRFGSSYSAVEHVLTTLMNSKCILNHVHKQLTKLDLRNDYLSDECLSLLDVFFKNGHASHLEKLCLLRDEITSRVGHPNFVNSLTVNFVLNLHNWILVKMAFLTRV